MRHIVEFDSLSGSWAVVDTESAGLVISFHTTQGEAQFAAMAEENRWPSRFPEVVSRAA